MVALPSSHCEMSDAKRRVQRDSCADASAGESAISIKAFPLPERHDWRRKVSFELRKGTWGDFFAMAAKTSARNESDWLIACRQRESSLLTTYWSGSITWTR